MKLLITGASGYVGAGILRRVPRDWQIAATYFAHPIEQASVAVFCVDVRNADAVNRVFKKFRPDVVIHTAALMTGDQMMAVNSDGSRHIARASTQHNAHLIHLSSDVIFDGEHAPYDENAKPQPITPYAQSKVRGEESVHAEYRNPIIVRTSLVYGFNPMDSRTRQTLKGEFTPLFTDEYRCPIFVDDLADALIELAQNPGYLKKPGFSVLNIAGPQRQSRYEFGIKLANGFHIEPKFKPAVSASFTSPRPRDCTLDISLAQRILKTRLRSVDEIMGQARQNKFDMQSPFN